MYSSSSTQKAAVGSASYLEIFHVGTTQNTFGASLIVIDENVGTELTGNPNLDEFKITIKSKVFNEAYTEFLKVYLNPAAAGDPATYTREDGAKQTTTSGGQTATTLGFVWVGAPLNGKRMLIKGVGNLTGSTGNLSVAPNTHNETTVELSGVAVSSDVGVLGTQADSSGLTSGSSLLTIETGQKGRIDWALVA